VLELAVAAAILAAIGFMWRAISRPEILLYALGYVVSFVGINWHAGVTVYLSRLLVGCLFLVILVRWLLQRPGSLELRCDRRILALFLGTIAVQTVSALLSTLVDDSLRQVFIYIGVMVLFVSVVSLADTSAKIVRALRCYVAAGIVQGLYGIYQVIGGPNGWPTYQTLLAFIPTANDRTDGGYYYTNGYNIYRAIGFFPGDVSHYAGYLAGVLLIALAFLACGRRSLLLYIVVVIDLAALLLSLSRSGIVAFVGIGLPVLTLLLWSRRMLSVRRLVKVTAKWTATVGVLLVLLVAFFGATSLRTVDIDKVGSVLFARMANLVEPDDSPGFESMELHIETRLLALDAFRSSPLIGVGLGVTPNGWYSERYQEDWRGAHSHHFNILGETGLLGATLEWMFMALVFRQMLRGLRRARPRSDEEAAMVGLLVAYVTVLVGNFFYEYYMNDFVWFLMGLGWALSLAITREARKDDWSAGESGVRLAPPRPVAS
jgi:hypothetical protein